LDNARRRGARLDWRPRVFFEEWNEVTGLVWASLAFAYFALVMSLSPLQGADEAWDLLVILGSGFAAILFLAVFMRVREDRSSRARPTETDEHDRRARETARASALRLNAYLPAPAGCESTVGSGGASAPMAQIIPFPARHGRNRPCDRALGRLGLARGLARQSGKRLLEDVHDLRPDRGG
jgi:hypothetical protein